MKTLSIIVPCYEEEDALPLFYPAVKKVLNTMKDIKPEFWFVNDGSKRQYTCRNEKIA